MPERPTDYQPASSACQLQNFAPPRLPVSTGSTGGPEATAPGHLRSQIAAAVLLRSCPQSPVLPGHWRQYTAKKKNNIGGPGRCHLFSHAVVFWRRPGPLVWLMVARATTLAVLRALEQEKVWHPFEVNSTLPATLSLVFMFKQFPVRGRSPRRWSVAEPPG